MSVSGLIIFESQNILDSDFSLGQAELLCGGRLGFRTDPGLAEEIVEMFL